MMQYISEQHSIDELDYIFGSSNGELPYDYRQYYDDKVMLTFAILDTAEIDYYQKLADRVRQRVQQFDQMVERTREPYINDLERKSKLALEQACVKVKVDEDQYVRHNKSNFFDMKGISSKEIAHEVGFKRFVPEQINMKTPLDTIEYLHRAHPEDISPKSFESQVHRLIHQRYAGFKLDSPKQFMWAQRRSTAREWFEVAFALTMFFGFVGGFIAMVIYA